VRNINHGQFSLHGAKYCWVIIGITNVCRERDPFLCWASSAGGNSSLHTGAFPAEDAAGEHGGTTAEPFSFQHSTLCCSFGPGPACCHRLLQCSEGASK